MYINLKFVFVRYFVFLSLVFNLLWFWGAHFIQFQHVYHTLETDLTSPWRFCLSPTLCTSIFFSILLSPLWDRASSIPWWPATLCVAEDDLNYWVPLPSSLECWDCRCVPPYLISGIKPRALGIIGKCQHHYILSLFFPPPFSPPVLPAYLSSLSLSYLGFFLLLTVQMSPLLLS